jgi:predicted porin
MKKTLVAFAALAAVGAASAQSSATISGNVQFQYLSDMGGSAKGLGVAFANVRFKGTEDLGGGLKASFDSEIGLGNARGDASKKRDTSLSLSGGFGTVAIANTRSSNYLVTYSQVGSWNNGWYGPYDYSSAIVSRPPIDALSYTSPSMGGAQFGLGYSESGTDGNSTPGTKTVTAGVTYANGPLSAGLRAHSSRNSTWASGTTKTSVEVGANYNFGFLKVGLAADTKRRGLGGSDKGGIGFGLSAPIGPVTLGFGTIKRGDAQYMDFRANYALSKRTDVELNYGKVKNADSYYNIVLAHAF